MQFDFNESLAQARERNITDALREDIGLGDHTAQLVPNGISTARLLVREQAVLCGRDWFEGCMRRLDASASLEWKFEEGDEMPANTVVCEMRLALGPCSLQSGLQ